MSIKQLLEEKISAINQDPEKRKRITEWIDGYRGKIIVFKSEKEAYHLIFEKGKVTLRAGDYSSCEFSYRGSVEVLTRILQRKESASKAGMAGAIKGWGSLNEAQQFERLLA